MFKRKLVVLCLAAASLLVVYGIASAGIIDPCASSCVLQPTPVGVPDSPGPGVVGEPPISPGWWPLFVCPQGDTDFYVDQVGGTTSNVGYYLLVTMIDNTANPIPDLPPADFWVIDCDAVNDVALCGGSASTGADSLTNSAGTTTIGGAAQGVIGTTAAGGCANGLSVVCQGIVLLDPATGCTTDLCKDIAWRSPDINGSLEVNLVDLSLFAAGFPPQPYKECADFDINGIVNLQDLSRFAFHFGPPGHKCA